MSQFPCSNPKCPNKWHRAPRCPNLPTQSKGFPVGLIATPPPSTPQSAPSKEEDHPVSFTLPSFAMDELKSKVEKKNRRLQEAGAKERFELSFSDPFYTETEDGAIEEVRAFINRPRIQAGPWTFVGALRQEEGGVLAFRFREVDDMPEEVVCDHCGLKRDRKQAYVIQHEEGELMTLGSTCVQPFLGLSAPSPTTLKVLEDELEEDFYSSKNRHASQAAPVDDVLKIALALSDGGKDYLSFDRASYMGQSSTGQDVRDHLFSQHSLLDGRVLNGLASLEDKGGTDALVEKVKKAITTSKDDSDYMDNLKTIVQGEWVSKKSIGILASAVTLLNRREAPKWSPGFVGNVGDKLPAQKVEVVGNRVLQGYGFRGGDKSVVTMRTEDGKMMTFFASRVIDLDPGQTTTLKGGTIKSLGKYQGNDQTVIARARLEEN